MSITSDFARSSSCERLSSAFYVSADVDFAWLFGFKVCYMDPLTVQNRNCLAQRPMATVQNRQRMTEGLLRSSENRAKLQIADGVELGHINLVHKSRR